MDGTVKRVLEDHVIGLLIHRCGQPDRGGRVEFLQRSIKRGGANAVEVGFIGDDHQIIQPLQVVEEHPGVFIKAAGFTAHGFLCAPAGIPLGGLRGDELLDVEDERQHRHLAAERELGSTILAGHPGGIILRGHHLRRHG